jgi:hypothetical protein
MIRKPGHEDSENVFKKLFAMSVDKTAMPNNLTLYIKKSVMKQASARRHCCC